MKFTMYRIVNRHYGFFNPAAPWDRDHYHKLVLDKATFEELGEPEYLEMTLEVRDDIPTQEEANTLID